MKTMRLLADDRMTVMMSIHQPSSNVFYSFDRLILLADGHTAYYGPPGKCLAYLSTLNFVPPADYNPADFLMDLVYASDPTDEGSGAMTPRLVLIQSWDNTETLRVVDEALRLLNGAAVDGILNEGGLEEAGFEDTHIPSYAASYLTQVRVLLKRAFKNSTSQLFTALNFFQCIAISCLCGLVWFRMPRSEDSVQDRGGFIFFFMVYW
jgi:ATP-binding cassette subfamily G (WHITE) protein 2